MGEWGEVVAERIKSIVPLHAKARAMIGFEANVDLDQGIQLTANSFSKQPVTMEQMQPVLAESGSL